MVEIESHFGYESPKQQTLRPIFLLWPKLQRVPAPHPQLVMVATPGSGVQDASWTPQPQPMHI